MTETPQFLSRKEVLALVSIQESQLMRKVRDGEFPQPFKISDKKNSKVMFDKAEVLSWMRSRMEQRVGTQKADNRAKVSGSAKPEEPVSAVQAAPDDGGS